MAILGFGGGSGNYLSLVLTPSEPPSLRSRIVSPLRGLAEPATRVLHSKIERPIKKPQPCRVEVLLLVEAAGTVLRL